MVSSSSKLVLLSIGLMACASSPASPADADSTDFGVVRIEGGVTGPGYSFQLHDPAGNLLYIGSTFGPDPCGEGGNEPMGLAWWIIRYTNKEHTTWVAKGQSFPEAPLTKFAVANDICDIPVPETLVRGTASYTVEYLVANNEIVVGSAMVDLTGTLGTQRVRIHIEDGDTAVVYK